MIKVAPLSMRLFLEGIEVPVISAQVNMVPSQPASAAIQIVPTDAALDFLPRTLVHLFTLETKTSAKLAAQFAGAYEQQERQSRIDALDENYILAFCGEVIGLNYSKSTTARSIVLQCMDLSSYWDTCYQWFADYSVGGNALTDKVHTFLSAKKGLFDNIARGHKWVISRILNTKPKSAEYHHLGGLLGGIVHLLEVVGGVRPRKKKDGTYERGLKGVTDFFTIAEARYNLMGMIGALEEDTTSTRIYSGKAFHSWMRSGMASMGTLLSFRDIMRQVGQYIFHDVYPNPAPYYVRTSERQRKTPKTHYSDTHLGKRVMQILKKADQSLNKAHASYIKFKDDPSTESSTNLGQGKLQLSSGVKALTEASATMRRVISDDSRIISGDIQQALTKAKAANKIAKSLEGSGTAKEKVKSVLENIEATCEIIYKTTGQRTTANLGNREVTVSGGEHMYTQLILPETFFVPPPRCNVIFPDQFYTLSYSRNFLREVSRLSCEGGIGFIARGRNQAKLLSRNYFAPMIRDVSGKTLLATKSGTSVLLPHELHSGIIPKFTWVTCGHKWGAKAAKARGRSDGFFQVGKVGYIQRLAHFQFFLSRWESRQMSISGVYNPYLVIGFPALIIDKPILALKAFNDISKILDRPYFPTQFLGKLHSITHHINQEGGRSLLTLTHCRTHRGLDDEFLGALAREVLVDKRKLYTVFPKKLVKLSRHGGAERQIYVALLRKFIDGSLRAGIVVQRGEKVSAVEESSEMYTLTKSGAKVLGYPDSIFEGQETKEIPSSIKVSVRYKARTGTYRTSNITPEEALMPAWYSDAWHKDNIGTKVYEPLLGTRAIHDDVAMVGGDHAADVMVGLTEESTDQSEAHTSLCMNKEREGTILHESHYATAEGNKIIKYDASAMGVADDTNTLELAIDVIAMIYGRLKNDGLDVHKFIHDYTRRPVATLPQVLGSANLEFGDDGEPTDPTNMKEGFHSRAFGDYNTGRTYNSETGELIAGERAMVGLFGNVQYLPLINRGREEGKLIPSRLDPRGKARFRVERYKKELTISRALMGSMLL